MSKRLLSSGSKAVLDMNGMRPVYDKGGLLIYEIDSDLYMFTNETAQFCCMGNKEQICLRCPDFCA